MFRTRAAGNNRSGKERENDCIGVFKAVGMGENERKMREMKAQDLRTVHGKWLWQRAGALETKLLKKYGRSMARISISNRFNKCIKCGCDDEPIIEIDYNEYRQICKEIESEYAAHPTEKGN